MKLHPLQQAQTKAEAILDTERFQNYYYLALYVPCYEAGGVLMYESIGVIFESSIPYIQKGIVF